MGSYTNRRLKTFILQIRHGNFVLILNEISCCLLFRALDCSVGCREIGYVLCGGGLSITQQCNHTLLFEFTLLKDCECRCRSGRSLTCCGGVSITQKCNHTLRAPFWVHFIKGLQIVIVLWCCGVSITVLSHRFQSLTQFNFVFLPKLITFDS